MARKGRTDRGLYQRINAQGKLVWYVRLYHQGKERHFGSFPSKTKARQFYEKAKGRSDPREGRASFIAIDRGSTPQAKEAGAGPSGAGDLPGNRGEGSVMSVAVTEPTVLNHHGMRSALPLPDQSGTILELDARRRPDLTAVVPCRVQALKTPLVLPR